MRSQDPVITSADGAAFRQQVERVGVHDQGLAGIEHHRERALRPRRATQPGTHGDDVRAPDRLGQHALVGERDADEFGSAGGNRRDVLRGHGDRRQSRPDPQACLAGQARRPRHATAPADDEHSAEIPLVRGTRPARQRLVNLGVHDAREPRRGLRRGCRRDLKIIAEHRAGELRAFADQQSGLQAREGYGRLGADRLIPEDGAGVPIEPRGQVQREYRAAAVVDGADDGGCIGAHAAAQPGAEQRIDDQLAGRQVLGGKGPHQPAAGAKVRVRLRGIPLELFHRRRGQDGHGESRRLGEAGEHVTVTAVVAVAADDDNAVRHRPARTQVAQRRLPGALHQRVPGNPQ
jgi:hypothetical protein